MNHHPYALALRGRPPLAAQDGLPMGPGVSMSAPLAGCSTCGARCQIPTRVITHYIAASSITARARAPASSSGCGRSAPSQYVRTYQPRLRFLAVNHFTPSILPPWDPLVLRTAAARGCGRTSPPMPLSILPRYAQRFTTSAELLTPHRPDGAPSHLPARQARRKARVTSRYRADVGDSMTRYTAPSGSA